jgi:hypothetical protein
MSYPEEGDDVMERFAAKQRMLQFRTTLCKKEVDVVLDGFVGEIGFFNVREEGADALCYRRIPGFSSQHKWSIVRISRNGWIWIPCLSILGPKKRRGLGKVPGIR